MKYALYVLLSFGIWQCSWAQFSRQDMASELMLRWKYADAYPLWMDLAVDSTYADSVREDFMRMAAQSALSADLLTEAVDWNAAIIATGHGEPEDWLRQLDLLCLQNRYDEIEESIGMALDQFPDNPGLLRWKEGVSGLIQLVRDSTAFTVEPLRPQSSAEEFSAYPFQNGLVFMSTGLNAGFIPMRDGWTGQYYTELTWIEDVKEPFREYTWFEQIRNQDLFGAFGHSRLHDGPVAFDADEDFAVLTRNHEDIDVSENVSRSRLKLEFYRWIPELEEWERRPDDLFPWNSPLYSCAHAVFDLNDDLVFSSDRPGGFGGMDLYSSKWEDGQWSEPQNLGPVVNTDQDEVFPFVSQTGAVFFSSNGHPGAGGLDIFIYREGAARLERLGYPINSNLDDFAFVFDETKGSGWLSSNRMESKDAIFSVNGNPSAGKLTVHVQACDGSPIVGIDVIAEDQFAGSATTAQTDEDGNAQFIAIRNRTYTLTSQVLEGMDSPPELELVMQDVDSMGTVLDFNYKRQPNRLTVVDLEGNPLNNAMLSFENEQKKRLNRVTNSEGVFEWDDEISMDFMAVHVSMINYWDGYQGFEQPPSGCLLSIQKTVTLRPRTEESEVINLENIYYDLDKAVLRAEGKSELDKLVRYMSDEKYRTFRVELSSHTDSRNSDAYNKDLSQRRAQSCVDYIIAKGIDPIRIIARGYGESQLVNRCADGVACTEDEHQANRRTELRLLPDE